MSPRTLVRAKGAIVLVALLLFLAVGSSVGQFEALRGGAVKEDKSEREEQFFRGIFSALVNFGLSLPRAVAAAFFNLIGFLWNILYGLILFFSSSVTRTTTSTITTAPTTPVITTMSTVPTSTTPIATTPMSTLPTEPNTATASTSAATTAVSSTSASTMSSTSSLTSTSPTTSTTASTSSTTMTTTTTSTLTTTPQPPRKLVFVTSGMYNGNLGGVDGADDICNGLAANANLTGFFRVWISNNTIDPLMRFIQSSDPYFRRDNVKFADNFTTLIQDGPMVPLNVDEKGVAVPPGDDGVWTNSQNDGIQSQGDNCGGWSVTYLSDGNTGNLSSAARWSESSFEQCMQLNRLYCFEQ